MSILDGLAFWLGKILADIVVVGLVIAAFAILITYLERRSK